MLGYKRYKPESNGTNGSHVRISRPIVYFWVELSEGGPLGELLSGQKRGNHHYPPVHTHRTHHWGPLKGT